MRVNQPAKQCEIGDKGVRCENTATEYVMDKGAGSWGGYACNTHAPAFPIRERLNKLTVTDSTCLKQLRDGRCMMDKGHRGRCTTVVYTCDSCGKTRRSQPVAHAYDANGDSDGSYCFMCVKVGI